MSNEIIHSSKQEADKQCLLAAMEALNNAAVKMGYEVIVEFVKVEE
jgi:hypothetical protein